MIANGQENEDEENGNRRGPKKYIYIYTIKASKYYQKDKHSKKKKEVLFRLSEAKNTIIIKKVYKHTQATLTELHR